MAMPATLSVLRAVFTDDRERAVAVGVWSAVAAAGFVFGPLLGGAGPEGARRRAVFADDGERAVAVGVWSAVAAAGFVFGPLLGGALLEVASWQWVFWAQLPGAGGALLLTVRVPGGPGRGAAA